MRGFWRVLGWIVGVIVVLIGLLLLWPLNLGGLVSHPQPVQSYDEAVARIEALQAQEETVAMNPVCRLKFMTHGQTAERAIIMVHGYGSCPQQFQALGEQFYDLGYNVLIAPLPYHGLTDRLNEAAVQMTAESLAAYGDEVVDIAQGLGQQVTMLGISAGGVTTAWAAQNRDDLDQVVIISPAFGFQQVPTPLTAVVAKVFLLRPNRLEWWVPERREEGGPPHAYPKYATHALAQTLRLSLAVQAQVKKARPLSDPFVVITNAYDSSVNNDLAATIIRHWQDHGISLSQYEFPADLELGHDLIDPAQPDQKVDVVYPQIIELVTP